VSDGLSKFYRLRGTHIYINRALNPSKDAAFTYQGAIQQQIFFKEATQTHALRLFDSTIFGIDDRHVKRAILQTGSRHLAL
jgi:hypothetical protein